MKRFYKIAAILMMGLFSAMQVNAQLSGTYVVGTGGDYLTLKAAVDSMISKGIFG